MLYLPSILVSLLLLVDVSRCKVINESYNKEGIGLKTVQESIYSKPILSCKRIKLSAPDDAALRPFAFLVHYDAISQDVYSVSSDDSSIQYILYESNFKYMASEYVSPDNKFSTTNPHVDNMGLAFYAPSTDGYSCSSDICIYNLYSVGPYYLSFSSNSGDLMTSSPVQLFIESCPGGSKSHNLHRQQQLPAGINNIFQNSPLIGVESLEKDASVDSNEFNVESYGFPSRTCNQVNVISADQNIPVFTFLIFFNQATNVVKDILSYNATTQFKLYDGSLISADNLFFQTSPNFDNIGVAFVAPAISGYNCSYTECIYNIYNDGSTFLAYGQNSTEGHFALSEVLVTVNSCPDFVTSAIEQESFSPSSSSTEPSSTSAAPTLFFTEPPTVIGQAFNLSFLSASPSLSPQLISTIPTQMSSDLSLMTVKITLLSDNPSIAPFTFSVVYNSITSKIVSIISNVTSTQYLLSDFNTADNKFFPTSPFFDNFGLSFTASPAESYGCSGTNCLYNIYSISPDYYLAYTDLLINSPTQLAKVQVCIGDNCPELGTTPPSPNPSHLPSISPSQQPIVTTSPTFPITAQPSPSLEPTAIASSTLSTILPSNPPTSPDMLLSCSQVTLISTSYLHPTPFAFLVSFNPVTNIVNSIYSNDTKTQYPLSFFNAADNNFFSSEPYFDNLGISFSSPSIQGYGCSASICSYNIFSSTSYHIAYSNNGVNDPIMSSDISLTTTPSKLCSLASPTPSLSPTVSTSTHLPSLSPTTPSTKIEISNYVSSEFIVNQSVKGVGSDLFILRGVNNSLAKAVQTVLKGPFSPVTEQVTITSISPLPSAGTNPTEAISNPTDLTALQYTVTFWAPSMTLVSTYYSVLTNALTTSTNNGALLEAFNALCGDCTPSSAVFLAPEFASGLIMPSTQPVYTPLTLTPNQNSEANSTNSIEPNLPIIIPVVVISVLCILIFCTLVRFTTRKRKLRQKEEFDRWRGNTTENLNMNSIYTLEAEGSINPNLHENQSKSHDGRSSSRHSSSADGSSVISEDYLGIMGPLPDGFSGSRSRAPSVTGVPLANTGRSRAPSVSRSRSTSRVRGHSISISLAANSMEEGIPQSMPSPGFGSNNGYIYKENHAHNGWSLGIMSPEYPSFSAFSEPLPRTWVDAGISSTSPDDPSATRL